MVILKYNTLAHWMSIIGIKIFRWWFNSLSVTIDNVLSAYPVLLVNVRPKKDLCLNDLLAEATLVKLRRLVSDSDMLPPRRYVLEELIASGAAATAVRICSQVKLSTVKFCKQNEKNLLRQLRDKKAQIFLFLHCHFKTSNKCKEFGPTPEERHQRWAHRRLHRHDRR